MAKRSHRTPPPTPRTETGNDHLDCRIAGALVRAEGLTPPLRTRLARLLQPFVSPSPPTTHPLLWLTVARLAGSEWAAYGVDGAEEIRGNIGRLLVHLEWRLVDAALTATTQCVVIHGAALTRGAATLLLVAPSGSGKTTLTLGLMARGWRPFGDDVALVDVNTLHIQPFPRCFHIDSNSLDLLTTPPPLEWPGTLAGYARPRRFATTPRQPTVVVLASRDLSRPASFAPITQAEAAGAIMSETIQNQLTPSQITTVAVRLAATLRGSYRLNNIALADSLDQIEAAASV